MDIPTNEELVKKTTAAFWSKETYYHEELGRDTPYFLADAAIDVLHETGIPLSELVKVVIGSTDIQPNQIKNPDYSMEEFETWDQLWEFIGKQVLITFIRQNDQSIVDEEDRRIESEM